MNPDESQPFPDLSPARPLRVAALAKQVPMAESLTLGPDGRLERQGVEQEMNPYCRRAVAKAVELARASAGTCVVFTLGPPQAEDVLREAVAWGADEGVHLCDPAFGGSDTLATARALAAALQREGPFDLVFTGRNTIDGDTGQVGPEVAELLGLPFATGVRQMTLEGEHLSLRLEHDDGRVEAEILLPAVLSAAERLTQPAKAEPAQRRAVPAGKFRRIAAHELGSGPWGQAGSPTRVGAVRVHERTREGRVLQGDLAGQVEEAVRLLGARVAHGPERPGEESVDELIEEAARSMASGVALEVPARPHGARTAIAVVVEPDRSEMARELLGSAAHLADQVGGEVVALCPTTESPITEGFGTDVDASWADEVVELRYDGSPPAPTQLVEEDVARAFVAWAKEREPWAVLIPSTSFGREVAGRAAASLQAGLVGDAIGVEIVDGGLVAAKPGFSGALVADITCTSPVQLVTVRPGMLPPAANSSRTRQARVTRRPMRAHARVRVLERRREDDVEVLAKAPAVVGLGTGVRPEEYDEVQPLVDVLGAELAATRKVTDKEWMPRARQVGLTGRSIAPRLYVALGVSGKFNHVVGIRGAGTVLAVNNDPDAPMLKHADIGIVGDWHEAVPLLVERLEKAGLPGITPGVGIDAEIRAGE